MPLIYITGTAAAGKSTVMAELKRRGYKAYGTDEDNLAYWCNKNSGQRVPAPTLEQRRTDFLSDHIWIIDQELLNKLKVESKSSLIFLCGVASNDYDLHYLFDARVCLTIDEASLIKRLTSRSNSHYGSTEAELENVLMWYKIIENKNRALGAFMIDATQPLPIVADRIQDFALKQKSTTVDA